MIEVNAIMYNCRTFYIFTKYQLTVRGLGKKNGGCQVFLLRFNFDVVLIPAVSKKIFLKGNTPYSVPTQRVNSYWILPLSYSSSNPRPRFINK